MHILSSYPFWVIDSLRTSKVHHCLSFGCPQQPLIVVGNLKFKASPFGWLIVSELQRFITASPWLPLVAQQPLIQCVIIGNLKFRAYFGLLYPLWVVDSLRTSMVHHCLSLVTIGCPQQPLIQWRIIRNFKFKAYFGLYTHCGWLIVSELQKVHHCLCLVTIGCPQQPLIQWVIIGNLKFKAHFQLLYSL